MYKCFLLLLVALLIAALPALACEHYPGEVVEDELQMINYIPPQEGVAGSADLSCPICGDIVDHVDFDPLPLPADHPAESDAETLSSLQTAPDSAEPEEPVRITEPETPVEPVQITEPETPVEPVQVPEMPREPEEPVQIMEPETPVEPVQVFETPWEPEEPSPPSQTSSSQPETPKEPEQTGATAQTETPVGKSDGSATEIQTESSRNTSSDRAESAAPKAEDVIAYIPAEEEKANEKSSTETKTKTIVKYTERTVNGNEQDAAKPTEKPQTFPFRRVKMKPKPGLRAEAAGELLWPVYGTPFQNIYND